MKKLLRYFGLLAILIISQQANADENLTLNLNNFGKSKDFIEVHDYNGTPIYKIEVELKDVEANGKYKVSIAIHNYQYAFTLFLFGGEYNPEQLWTEFSPRFKYDRSLKENRTQRCENLPFANKKYIMVSTSQAVTMDYEGSITIYDGKMIDYPTFELPVYFAKKKGWWFWSRQQLMEVRKEILKLCIEIKLPYEDLKRSVNEFSEKVAGLKYIVCNHTGKQHHPKLDVQKATTQKTVDSLRTAVLNAQAKCEKESVMYKEYQELINKLEKINVGNISVESCKYTPQGCSCPSNIAKMSLRQIYERMEELYMLVQQGKKTASEVMKEVKALKVHSGHLHNDPDNLKDAIGRYFDKFKKL